jgi:hypothetical protein
MEELIIPVATEEPVASEPPIMTSTEISDLHIAILDLKAEQENTNGLLIFLIAVIVGIVIMNNFWKTVLR